MKRILVPVDGTPRSIIALEQVKATFSPKIFEIVLVMVHETVTPIKDVYEEDNIRVDLMEKLDIIANNIDKYTVIKKALIGKAGARIVECAKETGCEMIVITKSTKQSNTIGFTASHIIRHAECNVFVVQDKIRENSNLYRGLIYKTAENSVTLRGQLSLKQSECMLPSVGGDLIYTITVTRGRIRFLHNSFNPDNKEWNLPPEENQPESIDISEGETVAIPVNAKNSSGVVDRIRIINRNMKTEAAFTYKITIDKVKIAERAEEKAEEELAAHTRGVQEEAAPESVIIESGEDMVEEAVTYGYQEETDVMEETFVAEEDGESTEVIQLPDVEALEEKLILIPDDEEN